MELGKLEGQRRLFRAEVGRFGSKINFKGYPEQTILLQNVTDEKTGQNVTNHLWFTLRKRLSSQNLQVGDVVQFEARVKTYRKFHRDEFGDRNGNYHYLDYKLSNPTKIKKIRSEEVDQNG